MRAAPKLCRSSILVALVGAAACAGSTEPPPNGAPPPAVADNPDGIDRIADDLWQATLRRFPRDASFMGDRRYDDALVDMSPGAVAAWQDTLATTLARVNSLDAAALTGERRVTAAVLRTSLEARLARHRACLGETWDIDQLAGYQVSLPELGRMQRVDSAAAAAAYVERLSKVDFLLRQHVDNLKAGVAAGRTAPKIVVERVIGQLKGMLAVPVADSPYLNAVTAATGLDDAAKEKLRADVTVVVERGVRAGLRDYLDYLEKEYLPVARAVVGVSANAGGAECYAALVRYYTGSTQTPQQIHDIGMAELERLHGEMDRLAKKNGAADWRAYFKALDADPAQHVQTRQALLDRAQQLIDRATAALPRAFGMLPPIPIGVMPIESFREAEAPAAYYYEAADDGSRPAYFYVNTYQPETRPLYNMEALAFHEAVPGHHLQISIAQALKDLPDIRRHGNHTAYVEGWALYAETVADELGLYSSDAARVGMFNYQAWRAARLVVDTGMHALGWDRERAVSFMTDNLALPKEELENEIDRYIIWPGQALAYMLGRMEIRALRQEATAALGDRFDVHAFHDAVLRHGAVPMAVLRDLVREWIAAQQKGGA